jgi:hypothetical protein
MQTLDRDEVTIHIDAPPTTLYDLVADVTQMPGLSPEVVRCVWAGDATGPVAGARFDATNKARRGPTWKNRPVVITADQAREFAFSRTEKMAGTVVWRYRFEPEGGGTRVTESYEVTEPVSRLGWFVIERLYGGRDRRADLRAGMEQTLQRLRALAETPSASQAPPTGV